MAENLTVNELKEILPEKSTSTTGNKNELTLRLQQLDTDGSIVQEWLARRDAARKNEIQRAEFDGMKQQLKDLQDSLAALNLHLQNLGTTGPLQSTSVQEETQQQLTVASTTQPPLPTAPSHTEQQQ